MDSEMPTSSQASSEGQRETNTSRSFDFSILEDGNYVNLNNILKRFKKGELISVLLETANISQGPKIKTKVELIDHSMKLIAKSSLDVTDISMKLSLKHLQLYWQRRKWASWKVKNANTLYCSGRRPEKFARALQTNLNMSHFSAKVYTEQKDDVMWTALTFCSGQSRETSFLLTFTGLPIVLYSSIRAKYKKCLCNILIKLYNGQKVEEFPVKTKYLETLVYFETKSLKSDDNASKSSLFPKLERREYEDEELPSEIINENFAEDKVRAAYLKKTFGTRVQPAFESVVCEVDTEHEDKNTFRVAFSGKSILEGLYKLVDYGMAQHPLPDSLMCIAEQGVSGYRTGPVKKKK